MKKALDLREERGDVQCQGTGQPKLEADYENPLESASIIDPL